VECTGWIWKHYEAVKLVFVTLIINPEQAVTFPEILPFLLNITKIVFFITHNVYLPGEVQKQKSNYTSQHSN
jgi:hypothetical protein